MSSLSWRSERGIALVTGLMLLMLASSLLVGFLTVVAADGRVRGVDRTRTQSFYAAYAGLEKLTADLGNLFVTDFSPAVGSLNTIRDNPPIIPGVSYTATDGLGYNLLWDDTAPADGRPDTLNRVVSSGPFSGFTGQVTKYYLWTTARTSEGAETRVRREMNTVAIPVFQFGVFSETDLTFSANGTFNFGGRVHTNGNLYLAASSSGAIGTTTLSGATTVVGEVVRKRLANTRSIVGTHQGIVRVLTGPGSFRNLAETEGSVTDGPLSPVNEPTWTNLSLGAYNGNIRNNRTGATRLSLPLVSFGARPIDLIRRPVPGENVLITPQRLFSEAAIRILLSDDEADITNLQTVSGPVGLTAQLTGAPIPGYVIGPDRAPMALSSNDLAWGQRSPANTPLLGGFLKVEVRNGAGLWTDVTVEWLNLGFTSRNSDVVGCAAQPEHNPSGNAIIRLQRVKQTPSTGAIAPAACAVDTINAADFWPLTLYDIREGYNRDNLATTGTELYLAGVMHYIDLDVRNLQRWLAGAIPGTGNTVANDGGNGYLLYFSDRRGNRDGVGNDTGEWGWEDFVNPANLNGAPNGIRDEGEDVNESNTFETYGGTPWPGPGGWVGWTAPLTNAATPRTTLVNGAGNDTARNKARSNPAIFFRRALKLTNGSLGNLPPGFSVVSENPVYVQGNYNAAGAFGAGSQPAAIVADAITVLSNNWSDNGSFINPNSPVARTAVDTWYRFGTITGKGRNWTQTGTPASFGTDGGVHNFLRLMESWNAKTLNYMGSLASFYYSRQANGLFRCCTNVYQLPTNRNLAFDNNFLTPTLLPPKTPMFRDVNTTAFTLVTTR